jgi:hypothetical protein
MPESNIALRTRSIYTGYDRETSHTATVPAVLMSAWRAPDGSVALALVNVSDQNVDLELTPNWEAWELSGAESWWQLDEDGERRRLASAQEQWSVAMAPQEALVVEWTGE